MTAEDQVTHRCPLCLAVFLQQCVLTQHVINCNYLRTYHPGQASLDQVLAKIPSLPVRSKSLDLLQCSACHASFTTWAEMRRHASTHTGKKHHLCWQCPQEFYSLTELEEHLSSWHPRFQPPLQNPWPPPKVAQTWIRSERCDIRQTASVTESVVLKDLRVGVEQPEVARTWNTPKVVLKDYSPPSSEKCEVVKKTLVSGSEGASTRDVIWKDVRVGIEPLQLTSLRELTFMKPVCKVGPIFRDSDEAIRCRELPSSVSTTSVKIETPDEIVEPRCSRVKPNVARLFTRAQRRLSVLKDTVGEMGEERLSYSSHSVKANVVRPFARAQRRLPVVKDTVGGTGEERSSCSSHSVKPIVARPVTRAQRRLSDVKDNVGEIGEVRLSCSSITTNAERPATETQWSRAVKKEYLELIQEKRSCTSVRSIAAQWSRAVKKECLEMGDTQRLPPQNEEGRATKPLVEQRLPGKKRKEKIHLKKTTIGLRKVYKCQYCGKECRWGAHLRRHELVHKEDRPVYRCDRCANTFSYPDGLLRHMSRVHHVSDLLKEYAERRACVKSEPVV